MTQAFRSGTHVMFGGKGKGFVFLRHAHAHIFLSRRRKTQGHRTWAHVLQSKTRSRTGAASAFLCGLHAAPMGSRTQPFGSCWLLVGAGAFPSLR